jgi:predicted alpha/beta-hydrolase family hydrolase
VVEPSARFEELKISLPEPVHGLEKISAVLGVPRWWPTGARVGIVIAHGAGSNLSDPLVEHLHRELTERRYLTLRFNFPFAEAGKRRPDSIRVLRRTFRAAISALGRDPADLAGARVRVDGLFLLGFPLHSQGKPEKVRADELFRVVSPMLFLQGTRDRTCDLDVLRRTLSRVGAPTSLHVCQEADRHFKVPKRSARTEEEVREEVLGAADGWLHKVLEG